MLCVSDQRKTISTVYPIRRRRSQYRGFRRDSINLGVSQLRWCIPAVTEQQSTLALFARFLLSPAKLLKHQPVKRGNVFFQKIVPRSCVFCDRRNYHCHVSKNIGMAKESEPARRMGWGKNNGSCTRSRWRRKTRGKNCTGIYSANNKVSARTRRTLRYCYELTYS